MKLNIRLVFLCFTLGTISNVCSDPVESKEVEIVTLPDYADRADGPNERSGHMAPGKGVSRPNPLAVCYACVNCKHVYPGTNSKLCPYSPDTRKQGKCVSYAERLGPETTDLVYIRGCASDRGTCEEIKRNYNRAGKYVQLVSCSECHGDKCNGAPKSMVDLTVAFITVAVLPLLGKCTLS